MTAEEVKKAQQASMTGLEKRFERRFKKKNGEIFWVENAPTAIIIDGRLICRVSIWLDITERKRRQKDMEYYVSEVIRAHEDERRYISSELHDSVIQSLSTLSISVGDTRGVQRQSRPPFPQLPFGTNGCF